MAEPKVSELIAKAAELGVSDEAAARKLIKEKSIRSYKRLTETVAAYVATLATPKSNSVGAALKVRKGRVTGILHSEGPRGFKFGEVWLKSVREGRGVAMKPSNNPKLRKTAEAYKVEVPEGISHRDLLALVGKAITG